MPFTANDNRYLADGVYGLDPTAETTLQKHFHPVTGMEYACIPRHPELGSYKVLDSVNDSNTGLQAMAVAPVDQNGQPDTTQITIAYAGTHDAGDYRTDAASIGFGIPTAQMRQADDFAKHIINTYKPADLSFTGHSLGGYTAMSMAGKIQSFRNHIQCAKRTQ